MIPMPAQPHRHYGIGPCRQEEAARGVLPAHLRLQPDDPAVGQAHRTASSAKRATSATPRARAPARRRALLAALARYIAESASRSRSAADICPGMPRTMPMLAG